MRKRNHTVTIRMNKAEYDLLQSKVKESGRTQQEVVIKAIADLKIVSAEEVEEKNRYYVVTKKAVPEVLLKVVEAKRLLESAKASTVQEAADMVGISRSSFYKYKDDIFPFHDNAKGKTITFMIQMDDETGLLSDVLHIVADYHANILTIHQSIPINGIASLTLSVEILATTGDISAMMQDIEIQCGVQYIKILARE